MKTKEILKHNHPDFLKDVKRIGGVVVFPEDTRGVFHITKRELLLRAEKQKIHYYISDNLFTAKREVMVVY